MDKGNPLIKEQNTRKKTIVVENVSKDFRIYRDKSHTLKQRILARQRNKYELHHVLKNISFSLEKGDVVGLIGHNGSGKSTTLKLLNRIIYPETGTITINGKVSSLIELGAGFHPDMTGRENIYINATIFGLKKHEIDRRIDDIIRFSELEEAIDDPVRTYSSGMYMRLAFSIAINVDAEILLVDEILAVGDANFQKKCFNKLNEIKENGATIVIVSHSMEQLQLICNRVIWIDQGQIREEGEPSVVCRDYLAQMEERAAQRREKELREIGAYKKDPAQDYPIDRISMQCGRYAKREGNMEVRFTAVSLCNRFGLPTLLLKTEDPVEIHFQVEGEKKEERVIQFRIFTGERYLCSSFQYIISNENCPTVMKIDTLHLNPGHYVLECCIFDWIKDSSKEICCDELTNFIEFDVYSARADLPYGIVTLESEWD